jgi:Protein of unknown function (DUF3617)
MTQRDRSSLQWFLLIVLLVYASIASAEELPALRPGLWEYQRTTQRSDHAWVPQDIVERVCGDPNDALQKQTETFTKLGCAMTVEQTDTDKTYRLTAECTTKSGRKVHSQSVTTFDGDSQYTSVIDSSGWLTGVPVQFAEHVIAKRIGDCEKKE